MLYLSRLDTRSLIVGLTKKAEAPTIAATRAALTAQAREIAKEAYTYGLPLVENYRILHAFFVDRTGKDFRCDWNTVHSAARLLTPDDRTVQTPNSDTPYSVLGADLRAEPLVLTMPQVEKDRYYSAQFVDMYTFNFAYVGSRTTGNEAASFLLAGPNWRGDKPKGVTSVIRCETELASVIYRTQLFAPNDLPRVKEIQASFRVQPLSSFLGKAAPPPAPALAFVTPVAALQERKSLRFFDVLNFVLRFCPTHPSERALRARFAKLGIGAGKPFDMQPSPELRRAIDDGIQSAWQDCEVLETRLAAGERGWADLFGSRAALRNDYAHRMLAAVDGIYGNSKEEALYPSYRVDCDGRRLDGARGRYTLRFAPGQLPPVEAFWSLTMYELPSRMLAENPLRRYLINSSMLSSMKRDSVGGLTIHIQHASPGKDDESNWLPAPNGPFYLVLRLYWPSDAALSNRWKAPALERSR